MDSFERNKILGAVLGTALLVMTVSIVSEAIYEAPELETAAYVIEVPDAPEAGGGAAGPTVEPIAVRLQSADVSAGEASARKCAACHSFGQGEPAKVGPNLYGIVGGPTAHMEGFRYSEALQAKHAEGVTWTFENLDHFLENPKGFVPGTAMAFAGLKKPDERADVIDYLRTLAASPLPLPEAPAEAAPAEGEAPAEGAPAEGAAPEGAAPAETAPAPTEGGPAPETPAAPQEAPAAPEAAPAPAPEATPAPEAPAPQETVPAPEAPAAPAPAEPAPAPETPAPAEPAPATP